MNRSPTNVYIFLFEDYSSVELGAEVNINVIFYDKTYEYFFSSVRMKDCIFFLQQPLGVILM
jgi:hypothetical protein